LANESGSPPASRDPSGRYYLHAQYPRCRHTQLRLRQVQLRGERLLGPDQRGLRGRVQCGRLLRVQLRLARRNLRLVSCLRPERPSRMRHPSPRPALPFPSLPPPSPPRPPLVRRRRSGRHHRQSRHLFYSFLRDCWPRIPLCTEIAAHSVSPPCCFRFRAERRSFSCTTWGPLRW
jgi:hypothetical protein